MPNWKKVITSGSDANLNSLTLSGVVNANADTDKFLVLDSAGNVDFRTGVETLSDINPGGLVSGSSQVTISSTTGYTTFSSSIASDITDLDSVSNPTLQDVTDNGATTTNTISVPAVTINSTGSDFLKLGFEAGQAGPNNTWPSGNGGVIIGTYALRAYSGNTKGVTIVGDYTANGTTVFGDGVTLVGHNIAPNSTTKIGDNTTIVGYQAIASGFSGGGKDNTIIGSNALFGYKGGNDIIGIGYNAGPQTLYTGSGNFYIGRESGEKYNAYFLPSANSIYFGNYTKSTFAANAGSQTENEIVIGHFASGSGTNTVTIGNSSITNNYFSGDICSDVTIDDWGSVSASLSTLSGTVSNGTISGRPLGSNLENLVVDNVSLQLNSGTTYNGSTELTISAKTGSVANGNTTLVSGDGVYDYVNPISSSIVTTISNVSSSIASDISNINGSGFVDVSSGGASNRIAIFSDADSLKGDADVTYYSSYNPQSQVYDVWDDVNSEGIKSKTLTTQGIYVGQVGTNFTASIALEANVGPTSFYTETKAVGFNTIGTQTNYPIHVDTGYAFFINYHLGDGANYRAGTITINTNYGSSMVFSETSTADLGDTSAHQFDVTYSSGVMTLTMTTTGGCEGTMEVRRMVSI